MLSDETEIIYLLFLTVNSRCQSFSEGIAVSSLDKDIFIEAITNRTWSNVLGGEWAIINAEEDYEENYSNSVKLQNRSPVYNCHCYAWHTPNASSDEYVWIESEHAIDYLFDSHCEEIEQEEVGSLIVYFDNNGEMLHSGLVTAISGPNIYIVSKLGNCGVYRHLLQDCSYFEDCSYVKYYRYG